MDKQKKKELHLTEERLETTTKLKMKNKDWNFRLAHQLSSAIELERRIAGGGREGMDREDEVAFSRDCLDWKMLACNFKLAADMIGGSIQEFVNYVNSLLYG